MFGYEHSENGKEPQNEEVAIQQVNAKDAKKGGKDKKPNPKDKGQEEKVEVQTYTYPWENLKAFKTRTHLNGFWFIKFKSQILDLFYEQKRFKESDLLIQAL